MADIMTRWTRGYRNKRSAIRRVTYRLMETTVVPSPNEEHFNWPCEEQVREAQEKFLSEKPEAATRDGNSLFKMGGRTWIPDDADDLQLRLLVVAHCHASGHRGMESTDSILREQFTWRWSTLADDTREFVADCIHCMMSKTGKKIPRPVSETLHATKPNEVVHFDFLYMGRSSDDHRYVLVVKDDLSSYVWLRKAKTADAEAATNVLATWIRTFSAMNVWVSDQGSHFKNQVMESLSNDFKIRHHFTVAYSPWTNGTVESVNRNVLAACRALTTELKLGPPDWPSVLGLVENALNEAPLPRLGSANGVYRSPLKVMTGIDPRRSLLLGSTPTLDGVERYMVNRIDCERIIKIEDLQSSLLEMHKKVQVSVSKNRARQIRKHNRETNLVAPNFTVGDFVLVRRAQDKGHKLNFRWLGPRRITKAISELVYEVTKLDGTNPEDVHCARLRSYRTAEENAPVTSDLMELASRTEAKYELVEAIHDIGEDKDGLFLHVEWTGLPDKRDWTWVSLTDMCSDVPDMTRAFLSRKSGRKTLIAKAKTILHSFI